MKDSSSLNKLRLMGLNLLLHNKMQRTIISSQMEIHKHVNSFCQNSTNIRSICPIFAVVLKQGKFTRYIISLPWKQRWWPKQTQIFHWITTKTQTRVIQYQKESSLAFSYHKTISNTFHKEISIILKFHQKVFALNCKFGLMFRFKH